MTDKENVDLRSIINESIVLQPTIIFVLTI